MTGYSTMYLGCLNPSGFGGYFPIPPRHASAIVSIPPRHRHTNNIVIGRKMKK